MSSHEQNLTDIGDLVAIDMPIDDALAAELQRRLVDRPAALAVINRGPDGELTGLVLSDGEGTPLDQLFAEIAEQLRPGNDPNLPSL